MRLTVTDLFCIAQTVEKLTKNSIHVDHILYNGYRVGLEYSDSRDGAFYFITSIEATGK